MILFQLVKSCADVDVAEASVTSHGASPARGPWAEDMVTSHVTMVPRDVTATGSGSVYEMSKGECHLQGFRIYLRAF